MVSEHHVSQFLILKLPTKRSVGEGREGGRANVESRCDKFLLETCQI